MQQIEARQRNPEADLGPTHQDLLIAMQTDVDFLDNFNHLQFVYNKQSDEDIKIIAYIRTDRKRKEKKLKEEEELLAKDKEAAFDKKPKDDDDNDPDAVNA